MAFSRIFTSSLRAIRAPPRIRLPHPSDAAIRQRIVEAPRLRAATAITGTWASPILQRANSTSAHKPNDEEDKEQKSKTYSHTVVGQPRILRYALYTVAVGLLTYGTAAITSVKDTSETAFKATETSGRFGSVINLLASTLDGSTIDGPAGRLSEQQLWEVKQHERAARLGIWLVRLRSVCAGFSKETQEWIYERYTNLADRYLNLSYTQSAVVPLLVLNVSVYLLLRGSAFVGSGRLANSLLTNLGHQPSANKVFTLTTSSFTHLGLFHLGFSLYALWNFEPQWLRAPNFLVDEKGRWLHTAEASLVPHLVAFFIVAGTFSAFCSQVYNRLLFTVVRHRKSQLTAIRSVGLLPHVGASGALYAFLTMFVLSFRQHSELGLVFLPNQSFEAFGAMQVIVAVETCLMIAGLLLARQISPFGHDAHMGGVLFGYLYHKYGNAWWERWKRIAHERRYEAMQETAPVKAQFSSPAIKELPSRDRPQTDLDAHSRRSAGRLV